MATSTSGGEESANMEKRFMVNVLGLEMLDVDLYRAKDMWRAQGARGVYGGQIIGQALVAAQKTVPEAFNLHSTHNYFLRSGSPDSSVIYRVLRTRDGTSFCSRTVTAAQNGAIILTLQASFHREGSEVLIPISYQPSFPQSVKHYSLLEEAHKSFDFDTEMNGKTRNRIRNIEEHIPLSIRPLDPDVYWRRKKPESGVTSYWVKARGHIGDSQNAHRCVAAYISDWSLLWSSLCEYPDFRVGMIASLDHAMWFHKPFRTDEWMLYEGTAMTLGNNRALCIGRLWREDRQLAVTIVQEGLIRPRAAKL